MQPTASDHDMRPGTSEQQHRGNPGQTYNNSNGQEQMMSNGYNAQDPQQMTNSGNGAQPAAVDRRDTLTRWLDKIEKKFGGERFNNPDNAEKNRALNANILKRVKQVGKLVMKRGPGVVMKMMR